MADFILGVDLQIQNVLGLQAVRQQLSSVTAQLGSAGGLGNLVSQANNLNTAIGKASTGLNTFASTVAKAKPALNKTANATKNASKAADNFADSVFIAGKRYAAFIVATSAAFKVVGAINEGTKAVIEFDQAIISLRQIIGEDAKLVEDLSNRILDLSTSTGTSVSEISDLSRVLAQAGLRGEELTTTLDALAKVPLTPTFDDVNTATEGVLAALAQFSNEGLTATDVLDKFTAVANKFNVTAADLATGVSKGGAAFVEIGGTLDEFAGAFAVVREKTRESEATIGTFFKTLSSRLATADIREFLQGRGISLTDQTGNFVGPIQALTNIREALDNIVNVQDRVEIANKVAGRRQVSRFLALVNNLDRVSEAIDTSSNSAGTFDDVASQGLQSINVQLNILAQTARKLAIDLGEDLFIPIIRGLTSFGQAAITALDAIKPLIPALTTLAGLFATGALARGFSAFVAPRLGQIGSIAAGGAAAGAARSAGGGAGAAALAGGAGFLRSSPFAQAALTTGITAGLAALSRKFVDAGTGIDGFTTNTIQAAGAITSAILLIRSQTLTNAFTRAAGGATGLGGAIRGGAGVARAIAPLALVAAGIQGGFAANELADDVVSSALKGIEDIELDPATVSSQNVSSLKDAFSSIGDKINEAVGDRISTFDPADADGIIDGFSRLFKTGSRVLLETFRGNFDAAFSRAGLSEGELERILSSAFDRSPALIAQIGQSVNNILADNLDQIANEDDLVRARAVAFRNVARDTFGVEDGQRFITAFNNSEKAVNAFEKSVNLASVATTVARREFNSVVFPPGLTRSLFELSSAATQVSRSLETTARVFDAQISLIQGVGAPSVADINFDTRQLQEAVARGQFATLLNDQPILQEALQNFAIVQSAFDAFVEEIGGVDAGFIARRGPNTIATDFLSAVDVPQEFRDRLQEFLGEIAGSFGNKEILSPEQLQERFDTAFKDIRTGADGITEALQTAIRGIFVGIEDELNRTTQIRQLELDAAQTPGAQAQFLQEQLQRAGIQAPRLQRNLPEFATTVEDLQRERQRRLEDEQILGRFTGGNRIGGQAVLRQTGQGELLGQQANLNRLVRDEGLRGRVDDEFVETAAELTKFRAQLEQLSESGEGTTATFFETATTVRELSARLIELQTVSEALSRATTQQRQVTLDALATQQQVDLERFRARTFDRAAPTEAGQLRATRQVEDFQLEQQREFQRAVREFDEIQQREAQTRLEAARVIDANTPRQEEAASLLNRGAITFSEAVDRFREIRDLRPQQDGQALQQGQEQQQQNILPTLQELVETQKSSAATQEESKALQEQANEQNAVRFQGFSDETLKALIEINREGMAELGETTNQNSESLKENSEVNRQLIEELNRRGTLKIETDQQVSVNVEGLTGETADVIRPLLEEAGNQTARVALISVLRSLAEKTDSETATAIQNVIGELA